MQTVLICPGDRPAVGFLSQVVPLVALPILGESLVATWIEFLANRGAHQVLVLATDRPETVRAAAGDGSRWGVRVQVQAELKEFTPEEALTRLGTAAEVILVDHLPGLEGSPLFRSYRDWYGAVLTWLPLAAKLDRIGWREVRPQIWCGRRTVVSPTARLEPPCWLGDQVRVGPDAIIGPNTILEHRVVVDRAAEIVGSVVCPDTFVGSLTRLESSIAWGSILIDWRTASCTQVPDSFLLCSLGQRYLAAGGGDPAERAGERGLWSYLVRPWEWVAALPTRWR